MVGFLFDSELGQHGRLSILDLGSMVGFLFTSWAAWSALYSELGQHGRLYILNLDSMVGFLF